MMEVLRIRLGDQDRTEMGVTTEWLELDPAKLLLSEAEVLDGLGINWMAMRNGEPVLNPDTGERLRDPASGSEVRRFGPGVQRVWIWMGLRRAGHDMSIMDIDVDLDQLVIEFPKPTPVSTGKGDAPAEASPKNARRSPRSSDTPSPRSPKKR